MRGASATLKRPRCARLLRWRPKKYTVHVERYEFIHERGDASSAELDTAIETVLRSMRGSSGEWARIADDLGVEADALDDLRITVYEPEAGIEPVSAIILAFVGGVASRAGQRFWDQYLEKQVKQRLGGRAIGRRTQTRELPPPRDGAET